MGLCEYCTKLPAKLFSSRRNEQSDYDHQPTLSALGTSATGGCRGCHLILHAVESSQSEHAAQYALPRTWKPDDRVRLSSTKFGWQVVRVGWTEAGHFRGFAIPSDWKDWDALQSPSFRGAGRDDGSVRHLVYESRLIQRWTGFLPTRLINVGTEAGPRLTLVLSAEIETADKRYIALSHCWGLTMPEAGKTMVKTLNDHLASIAEDRLPRSFRDFVQNTRRLGVPYVWIDSLCIVQDSREDWEREAAQMADVYSNAHLTMAASGSADGRGGCQVADHVRSYGPVDIECRVNVDATAPARDSTAATIAFRLWSRDTYPVGQILGIDPLTKRGWSLQERELSPRVVHYCRDTIRWECRESRATIEFPWCDAASFDVGRLLDGASFTRPTLIGVPNVSSKPLSFVTKQRLSWFELVDRYTSRALTKQTDILPAFSGIARSIAATTSDEYLAGLWKSYFGHCLLWASNWHVGRGFRQHSRPADHLAPSWSWASVKGPIHYLSWINGYWHSFNADPDPAYVPRLVDISLQPSSDPYGALRAATLRIEGRVAMAICKQEAYAAPKDHLNMTFTAGHQDRQLLVGISGGKFEKVGDIRYDVPLCPDCSPIGRLALLWLLCCMNSERTSEGKVSTFAIALQGDDDDDDDNARGRTAISPLVPTRFRRVGVAWGIDPLFWNKAVTATLTIV
ncbi:Heterokaryon incompatibility [Metarhizium album ARSEF 1941]|uniref:Heterokaryon incompatibility n=1 Tax=Metarhizium album (strain ARSEF 1941) TaxID=1081103 RepID=A0A0B2X7C1_METAS|nr:Heterokaryon incompatibility [Metarhizium album ARSEF 1941]KHO01395.1 Heterokaryon incompatibility [Metarhizium album ARSEF 1941]